jgi:parvulin-like peptidyl-prolyl isomerase
MCYNLLAYQTGTERIKTLKRILIVGMLLLTVVLAACSQATTSTTASPTPTAPPPTPTEPPETALTPAAEAAAEPGGVEVALTLVDIPEQEVIAVVNGEEISTVAYQEDLVQALYAVTGQYMVDWNDPETQSFLPALQQQVLDQVIDRALLRQLARQEDIAADSEALEAELTELKTQVQESEVFSDWDGFLTENGLTEESLRRMIADNLLVEGMIELQGGPQTAEHVQASHILVETEETGQEVLDKLAEGEDFSALAAEYSTDPGSKDQGGDLGWFPRGRMVPEFEEVAFALEPGETSELVQSDYGYHIIQVHAKEERELDPDLYAQMQQQEFQTWFEAQQAGASVERLYDFQASE